MSKHLLLALTAAALFAVTAAVRLQAGAASPATPAASPPAVVTNTPASVPAKITPLVVSNTSGSPISNQQVTYVQPFATGDVSASQKIQVVKSDGVTPVTTQEDGCSKWRQDNSRKSCVISFVEPDTISGSGGTATYYIKSAGGSPNTTPNVTNANITASTNIILKTSDLFEAQGKQEPGTWDLIGLNYVLSTCARWNTSKGYGANPICGWDVVQTGPNRYGIHAFQYPRREGDHAVQKWLRTDIWVDFWGSHSTPCPCSVSYRLTEPNIQAGVGGGTVGGTTEGAYVFSAQLYNGANLINSLGGANDARTGPVTFNGYVYNATIPWYQYSPSGVFPIRFTGGTLPTGLTANTIYWIWYDNGSAAPTTRVQVWTYQCQPVSTSSSCTGHGSPIVFTGSGSGTITGTPYISVTPRGAADGLDSDAHRFWINSSGTVMMAPPVLVAHDITYLSQKTKATPPYITSLSGRYPSFASIYPAYHYWPGAYMEPYSIDTTGDSAGDLRIGYIDHFGAYALNNPLDAAAANASAILAASYSRYHMHFFDERSGIELPLNGGHNDSGVTYPGLGQLNPAATIPISTNVADLDPFNDSYGANETSHQPMPFQAPYLKTGDPLYLSEMIQETDANFTTMMFYRQAVGGHTFWRPYAAYVSGNADVQPRGLAWGWRNLFQLNYFIGATAPMSQVMADIEADNINIMPALTASLAKSGFKSLNYLWVDVPDINGNGGLYQFWQDDFIFLVGGIEKWRGEYANTSWITNYFARHVIGRMDPNAGGCLWAGSSREEFPYTAGNSSSLSNANLATTWNSFYLLTKTTASAGSAQWRGSEDAAGTASLSRTTMNVSRYSRGSSLSAGQYVASGIQGSPFPYGTRVVSGSHPNYTMSNAGASGPVLFQAAGSFTCPSFTTGGLMQESPGDGGAPISLIIDQAGSAAIGSVLGVADSLTIYNQIRTYQYSSRYYTPTLSFTNYQGHGYPEWAFGPLGATQ